MAAAASSQIAGAAPAAAAAGPKNEGWMGARRRQGRWASELRLPRTRTRLWIGTFGTPQEAGLAYDAAVYCFYGARIPRTRKINFPTAPRPNIPEHMRVRLTVSNIRAIAESYSRKFAPYFVPGQAEQQLPPAAPPPAPLMVEAAVSAVHAADVRAGADATTTGNHDNMNSSMDAAFDEYFLSFNPEEEFESMMAGI